MRTITRKAKRQHSKKRRAEGRREIARSSIAIEPRKKPLDIKPGDLVRGVFNDSGGAVEVSAVSREDNWMMVGGRIVPLTSPFWEKA